jgi:putative transposase
MTPIFSVRWNLIKGGFSRALPPAASRPPSKIVKREKGLWQRRYWEHAIRNDADLARHVDYIHFNPVVSRGQLPPDWDGNMREIAGAFGK